MTKFNGIKEFDSPLFEGLLDYFFTYLFLLDNNEDIYKAYWKISLELYIIN